MMMIRILFIIHITIIQAENQYLGCFIDQIGNRDLNIFLGDYEQLTPEQCLLSCQQENHPYAGIQYGNECRCGKTYGKYGRVSDEQCDYLCSTSDKCGGLYRNSIYTTKESQSLLSDNLIRATNNSTYTSILSFSTSVNRISMRSISHLSTSTTQTSTVFTRMFTSTEMSPFFTDPSGSQTDSPSLHTDTSTTIISSQSYSQMDTMQSFTSTVITDFNSNPLTDNEISLTDTVVSMPTTISTNLFELSTTSMLLESNFSSNIPLTSTTIVAETTTNNFESTILNRLFLFTNSFSNNSTDIDTQTTITSSFHTDINSETTDTDSILSSTESINTPRSVEIASKDTVAVPYIITTVLLIPVTQNLTNDNSTRQSLRSKLSAIINLAFQCLNNASYPNCTVSTSRRRRQSCQTGFNVNLISDITQIAIGSSPSKYQINYTVSDSCNPGTLLYATQVRQAVDTLPPTLISTMLGYAYEGNLIRSETIGKAETATTDQKLWIIGAVLGPVAFVLLLIFLFCYLHYKCRPRPNNRPLTKVTSNGVPVSARSKDYQAMTNESVKEKGIYSLTQNDPLAGAHPSAGHVTPRQSEKTIHALVHPPTERVAPTQSDKTIQIITKTDPLVGTNPTSDRRASIQTEKSHEHPISNEISMDEIRRLNDVERWRNKLRLQEKFQQSPLELQPPTIPHTNSYQYDNRTYEHEPTRDVDSKHSPHPISKTPEVATGRAKLHRLLDDVLDKTDSEDLYNPDSDIERIKRRRQRRRINSISNDQKLPPTQSQTPHTPVIPQVLERPDPAIVNLRYNPYEAGDRAHDIERFAPVELKPKYEVDDQRQTQYSSRSNPPLFYDEANLPDRAATATDAYANPKRQAKTRVETDREATMRHDGGRIDQRQHQFNNDAVYVNSIANKNRNGYRVQARTAWVEPEIDHNSRDEYVTAKRSAANTRNIISSIHDELQHMPGSKSDYYHA